LEKGAQKGSLGGCGWEANCQPAGQRILEKWGDEMPVKIQVLAKKKKKKKKNTLQAQKSTM